MTSPCGSIEWTVRFARSTAANIVVRASSRRFSHPGSWYACPGVRYVCQIMSLPMNSRTFFRRGTFPTVSGDAGDCLMNAEAAEAARFVERIHLEPRIPVHDGQGFFGESGAGIDRIDRAQQPRPIRCQILNGGTLDGAISRGDHRCEIIRTEGLHRAGRDLPRADGWLFHRDRPIQEDDERADRPLSLPGS